MAITKLGKYELHEQLGRGGFGTVYRATDTVLGRDVALKILHPQLTVDADFIERFRSEARKIAAFDHPNIATVYELGEESGRVFIAMRYLPGGSLRDRLQKTGALPFEQAFQIIKDVSAGLEVAHAKGLIHRDIKPENILFTESGQAVISDFGLAKAIQSSTSSSSSSSGGVGTPAYRAPELWNGKPPASLATDEYSLACVFTEMLTGTQLFEGDTPAEIITQHLVNGAILPEKWPSRVPEGINPILEKALDKDPAKRYQDINSFVNALQGLKEAKEEPEPEVHLPAPEAMKKLVRLKKNELISLLRKPDWRILGVLGIVFLIVIYYFVGKSRPNTSLVSITTETLTPPPLQSETLIYPTYTNSPRPTQTPMPATPAPGIGSTMVSDRDDMTLRYVPAGNFTMGSESVFPEEQPVHSVYLDAFWMDRTDITNKMYALCVNAGACSAPGGTSSFAHSSYYGNSEFDNYPVIHVDWTMANTYCKWAGRQLPTEAQWEKAARGTDGNVYPWGNNVPSNDLLNYNGVVGDTTEVGKYPKGASPYGVLDMAGNVWQWVADWYSDTYYASSPAYNPLGPDSGQDRMLRGGAWYNSGYNIRSAHRYWFHPSYTYYGVGFRCSRTAP